MPVGWTFVQNLRSQGSRFGQRETEVNHGMPIGSVVALSLLLSGRCKSVFQLPRPYCHREAAERIGVMFRGGIPFGRVTFRARTISTISPPTAVCAVAWQCSRSFP